MRRGCKSRCAFGGKSDSRPSDATSSAPRFAAQVDGHGSPFEKRNATYYIYVIERSAPLGVIRQWRTHLAQRLYFRWMCFTCRTHQIKGIVLLNQFGSMVDLVSLRLCVVELVLLRLPLMSEVVTCPMEILGHRLSLLQITRYATNT